MGDISTNGLTAGSSIDSAQKGLLDAVIWLNRLTKVITLPVSTEPLKFTTQVEFPLGIKVLDGRIDSYRPNGATAIQHFGLFRGTGAGDGAFLSTTGDNSNGVASVSLQAGASNPPLSVFKDGNVSVGSATPNLRLSIRGTGTTAGVFLETASAPIGYFGAEPGFAGGNGNATNVMLGSYLGDVLFGIGSMEYMRLTNAGHVAHGITAVSQFGLTGTARIHQIHNKGVVANSQSHLILTSGAGAIASSLVGSLTWGLPSVSSDALGRLANISVATAASHTAAAPAGVWYLGVKGPTDAAPVARVVVRETGNVIIGSDTDTGGIRKLSVFAASGGEAIHAKTLGVNDTPISTWNTATSGNNRFVSFLTEANGTERGAIYYNRLTNSMSYALLSDYRMKTVTGELTTSGDYIDRLKPCVGFWNENKQPFVGFLAHEFQEVSPGSVFNEKDGVDAEGKPILQQMDYSTPETMANIIAELKAIRAREKLKDQAIDELKFEVYQLRQRLDY